MVYISYLNFIFNMKVVCINNNCVEKLFELNKVYEVMVEFGTDPIYLLDINGYGYFGSSIEFITLKDYRRIKLEKLNNL